MSKLRGRLARLERARPVPGGRCPDCPPPGPIPIVEVDEAGNVLSGAYPPRCAPCGGPYTDAISFIEMVMPAEPPGPEATPP